MNHPCSRLSACVRRKQFWVTARPQTREVSMAGPALQSGFAPTSVHDMDSWYGDTRHSQGDERRSHGAHASLHNGFRVGGVSVDLVGGCEDDVALIPSLE